MEIGYILGKICLGTPFEKYPGNILRGLKKMKKYDWKDSNMELVGSDVDRSVKKEAASHEPMWQSTGQGPCLKVWRIEKFIVKEWPEKDYGRFYRGDSYIVLKSYLEENKLLHDIHFWIGKESTQDEYATAAYKTVELDTYLDDVPVQHRECEGHESERFKSYFNKFEVLKGGVDSGFNPVKPNEYKSRLLLYTKSGKKAHVKEVSFRSELHPEDIFILDVGVKIFQWYGSDSNLFNRHSANYYCQDLKSERGGKATSEVINDESEENQTFKKMLSHCENDDDDDDDDDIDVEEDDVRKLFKISDKDGTLSMELIEQSEGRLNRCNLKSEDVFLIDTKNACFVWIGNKASANEKQNGLAYAHNYLNSTKHPLASVSCMKEGAINSGLDKLLSHSE
ncbi:gelsolin 2 [Argonauta hians]